MARGAHESTHGRDVHLSGTSLASVLLDVEPYCDSGFKVFTDILLNYFGTAEVKAAMGTRLGASVDTGVLLAMPQKRSQNQEAEKELWQKTLQRA